METTTTKQALIKAIYEQLKSASEDTLEAIIELLEDEEDVQDARAELKDAKINGTISWEEYKRESV
jgi:predicted transcriptional regulator